MAAAPNVIRFPEVARPDVTVVMLTYNRWDLTKEALRLLAEVTEPRYEVVIVDNASTDGTLDELDQVRVRASFATRATSASAPPTTRVPRWRGAGTCCCSTATRGCDPDGSSR